MVMLNCEDVQRHISRLHRADVLTPHAFSVLRRLHRIRDALSTTEFVPVDDARFVWELSLYEVTNGTRRQADRGSEFMSQYH